MKPEKGEGDIKFFRSS